MDNLPKNCTLPAIELHLQNLKLLGQDTSHYSKLIWRAQASWMVLHVECDCRFADEIKQLSQFTKKADLVTEMWGKHAHVSKVIDKDSTPSKIKQLLKVAQSHTNYQCSMLLKDIFGMINLEV
jgi:hypothetical protein